MNNNISFSQGLVLVLAMNFISHSNQAGAPVNTAAGSDARIDRVFFAQHHVHEPSDELFKLVGDLPALIKVQVYSDDGAPSPAVVAELDLEGRTLALPLRGPRTLPKRPTGDPVLMQHTSADSFTAMIPREWVKTGLKVTVELRDYNYLDVDADDTAFTGTTPPSYISVIDRRVFDTLGIGAPTKLVMQMFDIHYFGLGEGADFPEGWETELKAKLPVSELTIHRVRNIVFDEIVMPPRGDGPSARFTGLEDYEARTGKTYDGEQGVALHWGSALKAAGGAYRFWRPYHINICGVPAGGQAGGYRSCSSIHRHGVFIHELGHTFGLPHWNRSPDYPYKSTMYGREPGEPTSANAGPVWAFDVGRGDFIAPYKVVDGVLQWKRDPMQGGGHARLKDYMYNHFSDYSIRRIQHCLENRGVYWNEASGQYARWNQASGGYDDAMDNDGLQLPLERDVEVISLLASPNVAVPDANIVYPPIGPYTGSLIRRFDAASATDRRAAEALGYTDETCNVCLRVTQAGQVTTYLMKAHISPHEDPLKAFRAIAINLPARDGTVEKAELLYTPGVISKGIQADGKTLYQWPSHVDARAPLDGGNTRL